MVANIGRDRDHTPRIERTQDGASLGSHGQRQGTLTSNMDLSKRRGDAVVAALSTKYGAAAARLTAAGDGPTAPVASNDTEDGRAKNRRVELVKQ